MTAGMLFINYETLNIGIIDPLPLVVTNYSRKVTSHDLLQNALKDFSRIDVWIDFYYDFILSSIE